MNMDRKPFERRFMDLQKDRQPWEPYWKELQRYVNPTRGLFDDKPGANIGIDHKTMIDGEPMDASNTLASGMQSGLTSPAMPWFSLGVADPELDDYQPVRVWADQVRERMMAIFAKSNVYDGLFNAYEELGVFGTAALGIFQDFENVIRAVWYTIGEYNLAPDEHGRVRTFGRTYWMSVENMVRKFGRENVSHNTRKAFDDNNLYQLVKVFHLVEPNDGRDPQRRDNRNMPFRSVYWEEGSESDQILRISGFEQFPMLCPRWGVRTTTDSYGRGAPGWRSLGDSKSLQLMNRDELKGLAKVVDPPLQAPAGLKNDVINALPGGVTYVPQAEHGQGVRSLYDVKPEIPAIENAIKERQYKINRYFYTDLFRMLQMRAGPQMTAREIVERHEEKMMVLAPVLERIETELLDPLIERTFSIMLSSGLIPEPPAELQGMDLKVEYISVLAQAQKMVGTASIEQFASFVGGISAVAPTVLDKVDFDEMAEEYANRVGVPPEIIRSKEQVEQLRKERAAAEQQAAAMQQAGGMIQGAKVLSETKTEEPNALTALLGTSGPGGGIG